MKLNKLQVSEIQIERAVDLFFENDFVCSITLGGAAEEILGAIIKHSSTKHILKEVYEEHTQLEPMEFSKFSDAMNEARNELKHANKRPDASALVDIQEEDALTMIFRAIINYQRVRCGYTQKMKDFYDWCVNNGKLGLSN
jgi:deoxyadenosine/deoxycytidine kinase